MLDNAAEGLANLANEYILSLPTSWLLSLLLYRRALSDIIIVLEAKGILLSWVIAIVYC